MRIFFPFLIAIFLANGEGIHASELTSETSPILVKLQNKHIFVEAGFAGSSLILSEHEKTPHIEFYEHGSGVPVIRRTLFPIDQIEETQISFMMNRCNSVVIKAGQTDQLLVLVNGWPIKTRTEEKHEQNAIWQWAAQLQPGISDRPDLFCP